MLYTKLETSFLFCIAKKEKKKLHLRWDLSVYLMQHRKEQSKVDRSSLWKLLKSLPAK